MASEKPVTVVETDEFLALTRKMMDDEERANLTDFLAYHPLAGDVIAGTGGVRKLRWRLEGRGKSGGARVIYYYHDDRIPLLLLTAYAKKDQTNISHAARNAFKQIVAGIVASLSESKQ